MWHSVHTRFSDEYNFGLRADDTIVSTKAKEPSLLDILEEMGMMGGIGIHVMRG